MQTKRWDLVVLAAGGVLLWTVAGGFLWRELQVPPEAFLALGALVAAALAIKRLPEKLGWVGPALLLGVSVAGGGWFVLTKAAVLVPALGITTAATVVAILRAQPEQRGQRLLLWYGLDRTSRWKQVVLPADAPALAAPPEVDQFRSGEEALVFTSREVFSYSHRRPRWGVAALTFEVPPDTRLLRVRFAQRLDGMRVEARRRW